MKTDNTKSIEILAYYMFERMVDSNQYPFMGIYDALNMIEENIVPEGSDYVVTNIEAYRAYTRLTERDEALLLKSLAEMLLENYGV